jgi:HK97 gp10 family phage protein
MAARFRMSRGGVGELLRSEMVEAEMLRRAESIKSAAEGLAPQGTPPTDPHPGLYRASIQVTSTRRGGTKRDRATATVTNTAFYARWVEYGTEKVPAHHVMLRAAQAGGRG